MVMNAIETVGWSHLIPLSHPKGTEAQSILNNHGFQPASPRRAAALSFSSKEDALFSILT